MFKNRDTIKKEFKNLINKFDKYESNGNFRNATEETIRGWVNEMLYIFGWDVKNPLQIIQEKKLSERERAKLKTIESTHTRPDYKFVHGKNIKTFLDTKDLGVNIEQDGSGAFQVKSYGWSASVPCVYITNFKELAIYDCRFVPNKEDDVHKGRIYLTIDKYLENFELIYERLYIDNVISGNLEELYAKKSIEGIESIDELFTIKLSDFRYELAQHILDKNSIFINNDSVKLSYFTQVILDRIIFIRVCESRGVERIGLLSEFKNEGFWDKFKQSCYLDFYKHYDGPMFDSNADFKDIVLDNSFFDDFINNLYYPSPYRFDVIPISVLAGIYESFLVKALVIKNNRVEEIYKIDYIKTQGAISTPKHIVDTICSKTIEISSINSIEGILKLKILEPACGSGTFLISIFELLERKLIQLYVDKKVSEKYIKWFIEYEDEVYLTVYAKKQLMINCIFAIDLDYEAVEVAKMSLSLKIIDSNNLLILDDLGIFANKILEQVGNNIIIGNTLVEPDIYDGQAFSLNKNDERKIRPFEIKQGRFAYIFEDKGGFDFIVGNPPYVETKHYKAYMPKMHTYISNKYKSYHGKADLSIIFIERCLQLLNNNGKLGLIIQKRFFKTDYGIQIRRIISSKNLLNTIIDFEPSNLFKGKTTYVAIMVLSNSENDVFNYVNIDGSPDYIKEVLENNYLNNQYTEQSELSNKYITEKNWNFRDMEVLTIVNDLRNTIGTLSSYPKLSINDGIQALWKDMYHIGDYEINGSIIKGKNGLGEDVEVELEACKPVIYNKMFYCYKDLQPHAYCIFPYDGDNYDDEIEFDVFNKRFPKAGYYLNINKERIIKKVKTNKDEKYWHTFTRKHNQYTFKHNKIIIPMTAKDTLATCMFNNGVYMDNSNVWFIRIDGAEDKLLIAVSAVINSTAFSVFAKSEANPQRGGYYKFNKQFLEPVPFPVTKLQDYDIISALSDLAIKIYNTQKEYLSCVVFEKDMIKSKLERYWIQLDNKVYELYGLTQKQREFVARCGRSDSRIDILT